MVSQSARVAEVAIRYHGVPIVQLLVEYVDTNTFSYRYTDSTGTILDMFSYTVDDLELDPRPLPTVPVLGAVHKYILLLVARQVRTEITSNCSDVMMFTNNTFGPFR